MNVMEMFSLKGRVAIVTGGAGKLGSQQCDALAEAGAHVVVASRNLENCQRKAAALSASHAEAFAVRADVTEPDQVQAMTDAVMDKFGRIDVLVNNAYSGAGVGVTFEDLTLKYWEAAAQGALHSTFLCSQSVSKVMKEQGGGTIVNIASFFWRDLPRPTGLRPEWYQQPARIRSGQGGDHPVHALVGDLPRTR